MKHITKYFTYSIIFLSVVILVSCEKSDSEKVLGIAKIYMPQAAILDGGNTNNYPVPMNNGFSNYIIDSGKNTVNVILGVTRSGLEQLTSFTVNVSVDDDTTNQIISGETISNAILLPLDFYTLPSKVDVPDGQRDVVFYLTIDKSKLMNNKATYYGKKLLVTVEISNPTKYELNQSLCKTVVIIDSETFMKE